MDNGNSSPSSIFSGSDNSENALAAYDNNTNIINNSPFNTPSNNLTILDGKYFSIAEFENNAKNVLAVCMLCKPDGHTKIKGIANSSSNFVSHLKRRHGQEIVDQYTNYAKLKKTQKDVNSEKKRKLSDSATKKLRSFSQEKLDRDIMKFIIDSMVPLRTVENPYFREMFVQFVPENIQFKILSRKRLTKRISEISVQIKTHLKTKFQLIPYFCSTTDVWSEKKRSFLGVTIHWINKNYERESAALACRRFSGVHSFDRIASLLQGIYLEYGLQNEKILTTVTDNGSNFVKAFKVFGITEDAMCLDQDEELENNDESDDENEERDNEEEEVHSSALHKLSVHIRCFSHTLHLCATTDATKSILRSNYAQNHQKTVEKCNILWKAASKPKSAEVIHNVLGRTLPKPGITRWNSLYDSLKAILREKDKYSTLAEELHLDSSQTLTMNNFVYLEEYLLCSQPIEEALDILQGEKFMYFGIALPTLISLRRKLSSLFNQPWMYCASLVACYQDSINRRFKEYFDLETALSQNAAIAALSHPQFKNKWISCIPEEKGNALLQLFKSKVAEGLQTIISDNQFSDASFQQTDPAITFFDFGIEETNNAVTSNIAAAEMEVLRFFQDTDHTFNSLKKYPGVEKVFLKFNTSLPSSAPTERLFSWATITNRPKANRLSDENFELRVILKANSKYFDKLDGNH